MSTSFALGSRRHEDLSWDATDNVGWLDWSCWVPGRGREVNSSSEQPKTTQPMTTQPLTQIASERPLAHLFRLDRPTEECGTLHRHLLAG